MERAELEANLQEYRAQLQQVRPHLHHQSSMMLLFMLRFLLCVLVETLLVSDAENTEYAEIYDNLSEVRLSYTLFVPTCRSCEPSGTAITVTSS